VTALVMNSELSDGFQEVRNISLQAEQLSAFRRRHCSIELVSFTYLLTYLLTELSPS
jgi:hypothetical protein